MGTAGEVGEAVCRLSLYADADGWIRPETYRRIVARSGVSDDLEVELHAALRGAGFRIGEPAGGASSQRPELIRATAPDQTPTELDSDARAAVRAGERVLQQDSRLPNPQSRILKAIEERGLAILIRGGSSDSSELPSGWRAGIPDSSVPSKAFDALVLHNQRLVFKVARRYSGQGLELDDLAQAGVLGLMRAVEKFNHRMGYKFSTYATHWIQQSITREIDNTARSIRVPVHAAEEMRRTLATRSRLIESGRHPSITAVARERGIEERQVIDHYRWSRGLVSLQALVGEDGEAALGDFVQSFEPSAFEIAVEISLRETLSSVFSTLSEREEDVIRKRFGLDDGEAKTLEIIGQSYGLTRERIRQVEANSMSKLRHPARADLLRDFLSA